MYTPLTNDASDRTLFTVEGFLPDAPVTRGGVEEEASFESAPPRRDITSKGRMATIPTPRGIGSSFSIGTPIVHPLDGLLHLQNASIPPDIQLQMARYHFYWVRLACSFQAASGYRFRMARFQVQLNTQPVDPGTATLIPDPAIAYDMFPSSVEDELTVATKINVSPELKFTCNPLEATLALPSYERSASGQTYRSRIKTFDLQGERPAWIFTHSPSREIEGTHKLYLLVRKPMHTHVIALFHLEAEVVPEWGGLPQSLLMKFRRAGSIASLTDAPSYPLC
jgi:hypothetical protein